ncbi:MAG: hypothetical protein RL557_970 [archaeon]|jgi:hypothetical protein
MKKICPSQEIQITHDREIAFTDGNHYPWTADPHGYFLVKLADGFICCGFVDKTTHRMLIELRGKNPDKIVKEIVARDLCDKPHLAYISQELMIAHDCLVNNKLYVQR